MRRIFWAISYLAISCSFANSQDVDQAFKTCSALSNVNTRISCWKHYVEQNPGFAPAYVQLGGAYRQNREYQRAVEAYTTAIEIAPRYSFAMKSRGQVYELMGMQEKAAADFRAEAQGELLAPKAPKASFDCATAKSASARLICADVELASLDRALGDALQAAKKKAGASPDVIVRDEVNWIRERNKACGLIGKDNAPINDLFSAKQCMMSALQERLRFFGQDVSLATASPAKPVVQQPPGQVLCTHGDSDYFWDTITIAPSELEQFSDRLRTITFLERVRNAGKAYCAQQRANGHSLGQGTTAIGIPLVSAYPRNIQIEVYSGNERQVFATGDLNGPWERIESVPESKRLAKEEAERERQAALEAAAVSERARKQFTSGTGDPLSGVWSSGQIKLTIRKEGDLYLVRMEGNNLGGEYAGPYKNSQIELGGLVGNISVLPSTAQLIFGGSRFSKISE